MCNNKFVPSKHTARFYVENGIYHIYNRGVEKRIIFEDSQDYKTFLHYLKRYLTPPPPDEVGPRWKLELHTQINLLGYCLMPNHFHFLIQQTTKNAVTSFMRCLMNSYTRYFNEKHHRVGHLFQGRFKAAIVESDQYLLHLSRYIHLNPFNDSTRSDLVDILQYPYSSYGDYLGYRKGYWLKPDMILAYFAGYRKSGFLKKILTYKSFVEEYAVSPEEFIGDLAIEDD